MRKILVSALLAALIITAVLTANGGEAAKKMETAKDATYIKKDGDYQVLQSVDAYKQVYRKLYEVATGKDNQIEISNNFQF